MRNVHIQVCANHVDTAEPTFGEDIAQVKDWLCMEKTKKT